VGSVSASASGSSLQALRTSALPSSTLSNNGMRKARAMPNSPIPSGCDRHHNFRERTVPPDLAMPNSGGCYHPATGGGGRMTLANRTPPAVEEVQAYKERFSNWGRWGEDDQLGTLNHITEGTRRAAAALVRDGRSVSCANPLATEAVVSGPRNANP